MVSLSNLSVYQCSLYYFDQQWYRDTEKVRGRDLKTYRWCLALWIFVVIETLVVSIGIYCLIILNITIVCIAPLKCQLAYLRISIYKLVKCAHTQSLCYCCLFLTNFILFSFSCFYITYSKRTMLMIIVSKLDFFLISEKTILDFGFKYDSSLACTHHLAYWTPGGTA